MATHKQEKEQDVVTSEKIRLQDKLKEVEDELERLDRRLAERPDFGLGGDTSRAYAWEMALARKEKVEEQRKALRRALERLGEGSYGRCQSCGALIEAERLEILPATRLCARCARANADRPAIQPRTGVAAALRHS